MRKYKKGFSLLEVVIVIAIVAVMSSIGVGFYVNYNKNVEIDSVAKIIIFDLKQVQSKAMIGEGGFKWGIHFANAADDYYEIFSTPTDYSNGAKVIVSTNYLSSGATFSDPATDMTKDIIFNKISGGTSASSVAIVAGSSTKTISVSSIGNVSVQ
ncbi:hypothetical protein A3A05_00665 [Candidatus Nomurabacteria bacterium RIFCSPLOWO2_01_FULL_41_12]|uniref:General secretion pathway GspH domain-containing protein n=1 Tax=Candidatus Nomurabacteria bacterium RIFCSPLOWO2_01_FULL_41_12 TaxID=1801774 RepID=A0A1F6WVH4_9BACT|nr:MAG: hypothetical protein A2732_00190 [Candidatus Nomurabacteria bacterium RIFCSPHIGHO2_01_FULL_40_10]OGI85860.1 MAG: hypothetical protein A3A05_00665 [Candidatus Nomurabacteria bacterium RIFCSPLOWO2_01_FULL_41_12]